MIHEEMIFTVGFWTVKPGNEDIFVKKWRKFAQWTLNNQKGGHCVYMVQDQEQKNKFISFGPWDSLETIGAWRQTSKFKTAFAEFKELCDETRPGIMKEVIHIER